MRRSLYGCGAFLCPRPPGGWTKSNTCCRSSKSCTSDGPATSCPEQGGWPMNNEVIDTQHFEEILTRKESELARGLRTRGEIVIEKSADQMDEIQYAAERDLAIQNVDRESGQLREVKSALRRIADRSFGSCIQCEEPIPRKRLAA